MQSFVSPRMRLANENVKPRITRNIRVTGGYPFLIFRFSDWDPHPRKYVRHAYDFW